jgi:hypothetical protein
MLADLGGTRAASLASPWSPGCQQDARALAVLGIRYFRIIHHARQNTGHLLGQMMMRFGASHRLSPAPDVGDPHLDQPQYRVTLPYRCHRQQCRDFECTARLGNLADLDRPASAHAPRIGAQPLGRNTIKALGRCHGSDAVNPCATLRRPEGQRLRHPSKLTNPCQCRAAAEKPLVLT